MKSDWCHVLSCEGDPRFYFLIAEVPCATIKGPINRKPGLVIALPKGDAYFELAKLSPPFIIGQRVQALPFPQEA